MEHTRLLLSLLVVLVAVLTSTDSAPAFCRACNRNCFMPANGTEETNSTTIDVDLVRELEENDRNAAHSTRDSHDPLVLCALFLCTCCCGPKESRGKLPAEFLAALPMSKKRMPSEEIELEWGDGYVARKDSSRTKFSTTVSYIEARRESIWSHTSVASDTAAETVKQEAAKSEAKLAASVPKLTKAKSCDSIKKTRFSDTVSVISLDSSSRR
ncbi:unnamed protein product [Caenorhabditis sp. 36 PRJEB53466]|nr:unnamed protein product [Caenorhabditis sp. 36 PRJEB53466]